MLRLVRMLRAPNDFKFLEHLPAEWIARQHTFDGSLQHELRCSLEQMFQRLRFQVADIARVVMVNLVGQLVSGDANLLGVNHYDVVARIHVGSKFGLMLAA